MHNKSQKKGRELIRVPSTPLGWMSMRYSLRKLIEIK